MTAQFEGLVLVSTVFVDWWAAFCSPQAPCLLIVSCTVPLLCCALHRAQIFWAHDHQAFWPKVGISKVPSRLSCCCRIRARGSPSLHTSARQQRAKVRRLLHGGRGKQKRSARAAAILRFPPRERPTDVMDIWRVRTDSGNNGRNCHKKGLLQTATHWSRQVAFIRVVGLLVRHHGPLENRSERKACGNRNPKMAHRCLGDVGSGRGGQGPSQLSDADEWW